MWTLLYFSSSANWCVVWKLSPAETGTLMPARHLGRGVDLGVVGRLLEPGRLELGKMIADPDGLGDTEAAVPFDHDLDLGANRVAHRANDIERELAVTRRHRSPGRRQRGRT